MSETRHTKAELVAELHKLRRRIASLEASVGAEDGAVEALERSDTRTRHVLASAGALVVELDAKGAVTWSSPGLLDVLGYEPEELSAASAAEWVHEADRDEVRELYRELLEGGPNRRGVYRVRHKSGHWVWLETLGSRYDTRDGKAYVVVFTRDITQLKLANDALSESEERYRSLAERGSDLISEIDESGRLLFTTENSLQILGYSAQELMGRELVDSPQLENIHTDDRARVLQAYAQGLAGSEETEVEYRYHHADGSWRWLHSRARSYTHRDGALRFVVISRDVTERASDQRALRRSEERYRVLAETTHDLVIELDPDGLVVYASPNSMELLGVAPEELVGTTPFDLVHADDIERAVHMFRHREAGNPKRPARVRVRHKDGGWRLVEGGGFDYPTEDGRMNLVAVVRDVTDVARAEDERRKLEERIQQAQKLESLGVMAGGVAHDFNNLLTPILGDASLAAMDLPVDSPIRERVEKIQKAARRAAELTGQMLAYAGEETLQAELLDLSRLVGDMRRLLASGVSRRAQLAFELVDDLPSIEADGPQLSQVAMNLATNASEALGETSGRVEIRTGWIEAERPYLSQCLLGNEIEPGLYAYLEVSDTGCGMDDETQRRVFDPFFSTKFTGRGLGLAAVLGIVRGHHGAIEIDSEPGRGTRFRVLLPAAPPRRVAAKPERRGTALVADDDEGVRDLMQETLSRSGFSVVCAANGREAIDRFREYGDEIGVVLLDRTMPVISGEEAFDALREIQRDVPIVLISGYSNTGFPARFSADPAVEFLQKPFLPEVLMTKVRKLLDR